MSLEIVQGLLARKDEEIVTSIFDCFKLTFNSTQVTMNYGEKLQHVIHFSNELLNK